VTRRHGWHSSALSLLKYSPRELLTLLISSIWCMQISNRRALDIMSELTYHRLMEARDKPLVWLHGEVKTPPFSRTARVEAGYLLRRLQTGEQLGLPFSRPMPSIGRRCHELRVNDLTATWRLIYRIDKDAIIILEVFRKQTQKTPQSVIDVCKKRIQLYDKKGWSE